MESELLPSNPRSRRHQIRACQLPIQLEQGHVQVCRACLPFCFTVATTICPFSVRFPGVSLWATQGRFGARGLAIRSSKNMPKPLCHLGHIGACGSGRLPGACRVAWEPLRLCPFRRSQHRGQQVLELSKVFQRKRRARLRETVINHYFPRGSIHVILGAVAPQRSWLTFRNG